MCHFKKWCKLKPHNKIIMRTIIFSLILFCNLSIAQTYTHPTVGINNEYVGACMESTCSGAYYDNGGASNYSNNINNIYRTFCPNAAGQCVRVTFNNFNVENAGFFGVYDYLTVGNGPTQNSTVFTTGPADGSGRIYGTPATPFSYTSTHPSGCLTFRFYSDGSVTRPGWSATLSCVPCVGGPTGIDNNDCSTSLQLCSSSPVTTVSTGPGILSEGCSVGTCPAGGENHTNWFYFQVQTSGTFTFFVNPDVNSDDFDFTFFGPNVTCGSLGSPIRCSDAGNTGNTGLGSGASDLTEDVLGDGWLAPMNVVAGETYVLSVDRWSPGGNGYTLNFGGTASLDCTPLDVSLLDFTAEYNENEDVVDLYWHTASEINNDYFIVETSTDGKNYEELIKINGAGNTTFETEYLTFDTQPKRGTNYYRLVEVDMNGKKRHLKTISVFVKKKQEFTLNLIPNPAAESTIINFDSQIEETVELMVYDYSGQAIIKNKIETIIGNNKYQLNIGDFKQGVYMVTLSTSEGVIKTKLIKN